MSTDFLSRQIGDWTYEERRLTGRLVGQDGEWRDFTGTDYRRKD